MRVMLPFIGLINSHRNVYLPRVGPSWRFSPHAV